MKTALWILWGFAKLPLDMYQLRLEVTEIKTRVKSLESRFLILGDAMTRHLEERHCA